MSGNFNSTVMAAINAGSASSSTAAAAVSPLSPFSVPVPR